MDMTPKEYINNISNFIRQVETKMQEECFFVPAEHECLKWDRTPDDRKFRIICNNRTLQSCPISEREEHYGKVSALYLKAQKASSISEQKEKTLQEALDWMQNQ